MIFVIKTTLLSLPNTAKLCRHLRFRFNVASKSASFSLSPAACAASIKQRFYSSGVSFSAPSLAGFGAALPPCIAPPALGPNRHTCNHSAWHSSNLTSRTGSTSASTAGPSTMFGGIRRRCGTTTARTAAAAARQWPIGTQPAIRPSIS